MMILNETTVSIPPYLSTTWDQVKALYIKGGQLVITLIEGDTVVIPNLKQSELDQIFAAHSKYLESTPARPEPTFPPSFSKGEEGELPIQLGFSNLGEIQTAMRHNPEQADSPDLPPEILDKVTGVAGILLPQDPEILPKPEPHCNCFFCQIAKAIQKNVQPSHFEEEQMEEEVPDEELQFQEWEIEQTGDQMFTVKNRLDPNEEYHVFLGEPVGCTCGNEGCEHIVAVLKS